MPEMIETLSRRLRVRDDGTGKGWDRDATFAEFDSEDAIILLGDPGMGKTTLFRDIAKSDFKTVRNFLIAPHVIASEALFLDALDEFRTIASGQDASSEIAKALCALGKPKFRLSCRAADWFGSSDQEVLRVASASGRVIVLELRPLSREEILECVQKIVPDPNAFLDEAESAGLGKLLGNPQTLEMVARAWGTGKKPRNKFEAYEIGVSELLKETNTHHIERGAASHDPSELRKAAGSAASILLLSNSAGISRAEPADGNGYASLSDIPHPNKSDLVAVLKRRLFISSEVDRFEPIHRTISEFLAAEDLALRISNGLPIDRVMALICGGDGKPISSLRGLFAWLMCKLGLLAEDYVDRDPYGVATYGDTSVLPPTAQKAIWAGMRGLRDPWFLSNEDDRGSFSDLANPNTADIILALLQDQGTGAHLKIAVLEAIANSSETAEFMQTLRDMVLDKHNSNWMRRTALKALAHSVQYNWEELEVLDDELANTADDQSAPEVRVEHLLLTRSTGNLPIRILSILKQAVRVEKTDHIFGRFYPLLNLPLGSDLDVILNNASEVLVSNTEISYELQSLYERWLTQRLEHPAPITPTNLVSWLRSIRDGRDRNSQQILPSLKARFAQEPVLFEEVFELLANDIPNKERSFYLFLVIDLWKILPAAAWPVLPCEFFLALAEKEVDTEKAAEFFRMYLSWFPVEGASSALTDAGFDLLGRRAGVAKALGNWKSCKIEKWRKNQWKDYAKKSRKESITRAQRVAAIAPRLMTIREGEEERILAWAAVAYNGWFYETKDFSDGRERLVSLTNDEIAEALIDGFVRYAEKHGIPKQQEIIESWLSNSIPYTHTLLSLSVFLRHKADMTVTETALPHCLAAVVTGFHSSDNVPGYNEALTAWFLQEVRDNPEVVKSVLYDLWLACSIKKNNSMPRFYELAQDLASAQFLASLSADVLSNHMDDDPSMVCKLVSVLLHHDRQTALAIGEKELIRNELSTAVRAIWATSLFVINPAEYSEAWLVLMSGEEDASWEAIEIIGGSHYTSFGSVTLTVAQRAEVIRAVGQRFVNIERPSSGTWVGGKNPWDATDFVANQIKLLATDTSVEVDAQLGRLENDGGLVSYRDLIRHHRAQHEKQQRESSFTFASPERVAQAIKNHAPATSSDLLALIVDHLGALSRELARTQRERYRAYWNEDGRNLDKPKREEICSGLLADDLQHRVQTQGLIVTVEHHMIDDKECDLVVLQGTERLLPIEVKHHYRPELWTAWRTQLDRLYTIDVKAGGLGIYLVIWSGEAKGRKMPKLPKGFKRPASPSELQDALESLIPEGDRQRLRVVVVDISPYH